jgi:hypothetical protein
MNLSRISTALLLIGCNASNVNPELVSFNGQEPRSILGILYFEDPFFFAAGEDVLLEVEASDPDGDPLQIWFAYQPPGLCFDPDGTEGVWEVPENYDEDMVSFDLVLADDSDPTGITSIELFFMNENPSDKFFEEWGLDTAE